MRLKIAFAAYVIASVFVVYMSTRNAQFYKGLYDSCSKSVVTLSGSLESLTDNLINCGGKK